MGETLPPAAAMVNRVAERKVLIRRLAVERVERSRYGAAGTSTVSRLWRRRLPRGLTGVLHLATSRFRSCRHSVVGRSRLLQD